MSGLLLNYCPDIDERLGRLRQWVVNRDPDLVLAGVEAPNRALEEFARTHREGETDEPDPGERIAFWDAVMKERKAMIARRFITHNAPKIAFLTALICAGNKSTLTNYQTLTGPAPVE